MLMNLRQLAAVKALLRRAGELIEDALAVAEAAGDVSAQSGLKGLYGRLRDEKAETDARLAAADRSKGDEK